jgi:hypothetical protein
MTEPAWPSSVAFVSVESLLIVSAGLAAVGAALTAVLVVRARRRPPPEDPPVRRPPSPSSVGLDDDPIVAALGIGSRESRPTRPIRDADRSDPAT